MNNELATTQTFDLAIPQQALKVAEILQKFVDEKKLTANIQGKQYPLVEAWQFAGSQLGLYPCLIECTNLSTESEFKYLSKVEIRKIDSNQPVGLGIAICSNKEYSKKRFDEYAILSMAQTRATGKAFRNLLAWIMKAAGFEATPAEEMSFENGFSNTPEPQELQQLRTLVWNSTLDENGKEAALIAIDACTDYKQYEKIKYRLEDLQMGYDYVQNPNQKDINAKVKKLVKQTA